MARVATFHLVRERPRRAALAMARLASDRFRLRQQPGLTFWRLLGTGRGSDTTPGADLRRTAVFAIWDDSAAIDEFMRSSAIAQRWANAEEAYHVRLRLIGGHGRWRGVDVLDGLERSPAESGGPVAIVTRARVRRGAWRTFGRAGDAVDRELHGSDGLLAVVGIGEAPVGRLGTFSLWRSIDDALYFAGSDHHRAVVHRTRSERWYAEELFARFEPFESSGTWDGADPLHGALGPS